MPQEKRGSSWLFSIALWYPVQLSPQNLLTRDKIHLQDKNDIM